MKTAFIFKPSECWRYCGGGLVILADNFEEAQKLFDEELFKSETEAEQEAIKTNQDYKKWTLVDTLICEKEYESRIVLNDENWG